MEMFTTEKAKHSKAKRGMTPGQSAFYDWNVQSFHVTKRLVRAEFGSVDVDRLRTAVFKAVKSQSELHDWTRDDPGTRTLDPQPVAQVAFDNYCRAA